MSRHTCRSCGESFETLTKKRLHQSECPEADLALDVSDEDVDGIAERVVEELLVCDVCGMKNDGADGLDRDLTAGGIAVTLTFTCDICGSHNENEAILS